MKYIALIVSLLCSWIQLPGTLAAQTPSDAIMMKQGELCFGLVYEYSAFSEYWEGTTLRSNGTIAEVRRHMVNPMVAIGILKRVNLMVGLPYVSTSSSNPNGGLFDGASGMQDLTLALKGELFNKKAGPGNLSILTTAGYSFPVSNYLSDYRPYSLGNGTDEVSLRGIFEYQLSNGLYARASGAYLWRGQTEIELDFYYADGPHYSNIMDVPSAWQYQAALGKWFFDYALRVEAVYTGLSSVSGDDIRAYAAPQPTNKVNIGQIGAFAQVWLNKPAGLGALVYINNSISGRNMGKSTHYGAGLTYVFNYSKRPQTAE